MTPSNPDAPNDVTTRPSPSKLESSAPPVVSRASATSLTVKASSATSPATTTLPSEATATSQGVSCGTPGKSIVWSPVPANPLSSSDPSASRRATPNRHSVPTLTQPVNRIFPSGWSATPWGCTSLAGNVPSPLNDGSGEPSAARRMMRAHPSTPDPLAASTILPSSCTSTSHAKPWSPTSRVTLPSPPPNDESIVPFAFSRTTNASASLARNTVPVVPTITSFPSGARSLAIARSTGAIPTVAWPDVP